jgi:hypothetical protein
LRFEPIGLAGRDGALARWAVWPASAAARVEVLGDQRKQSDYRPQLRDGEGLVQLVERDLDGDGKVDRVTSIAIAPQQKPRYRRGGVFFVAGGKGISEVVARHPAGLPMHLLAAVRFDSPRRELLLESGGAVWLARSDGSTWAHGGGWSCQRPR